MNSGTETTRRQSAVPDDGRAQSEVLGLVLVLGITVLGTGLIVAFGASTLEESQGRMYAGSAEHAMTEFDSKVSLVAHGSSDSQHAALGGGDRSSVTVDSDAGWMNVTVVNETTGDVETELMNESLGAVVYDRSGTTIAYQGGGVWTSSGENSTMVSPPEFHYRQETLTLPLVVIDGGVAGEDVLIRQNDSTEPVYPDPSSDRRNPLREGQVVVTVQSDYYDAWGRFFEERTGGQMDIDHGRETATIRLAVPDSTNSVAHALTSTAAGGELKFSGSGNFPAYTDSYNSSEGEYSQTKSANGTILTSGDVEVGGNGRVEGNVESGGAVTLKGGANVTGDIGWTTGFSASNNAEYGSEDRIDGVEGPDPIDGMVRNRVAVLRNDTNNDNDATTTVENDRLNFSGSNEVTVPPGNYYLEEIDLDGQNVTFDTQGGTTEVAIGDDVQLDDSNIHVQGNGVVRFYVTEDIDVKQGSGVHVPDDVSKRAWFYGTTDSEIDIEGDQGKQVRFVGVIYSPSSGGDADVSLKHADLYGAVVGGQMDLQTGGAVHYDQSLRTVDPLPEAGYIPKVTYLHVSVSRVNVTAR